MRVTFKKKFLGILIIFLTVVLIIFFSWNYASNNKKKEDILTKLVQTLSNYPELPESYVFMACSYQMDDQYYFVLQSKDNVVTGRRAIDGSAEYYFGGCVWEVSAEGYLKQNDPKTNDVTNIIGNVIMDFFADQSVEYHYKKPAGRDLPLWVYPTDPDYLIAERNGYDEYIETIVCANGKNGYYLRWTIAQSSDNVELYLFAAEYLIDQEEIFLPGWGKIPAPVVSLVLNS